MKKYTGKNIREVWDYRLSKGSPILYANGKTWIVKIWANESPNGKSILLEEHDTGIESDGDVYNLIGIRACYKWLYSVRDKYARDNIKALKPVVKRTNEANAKLAAISAAK